MKAPIYAKVELLERIDNNVIRHEFNGAGMVITGNYIVIVTEHTDKKNNNQIMTGKIYNIENIVSYQTSNSIE